MLPKGEGVELREHPVPVRGSSGTLRVLGL